MGEIRSVIVIAVLALGWVLGAWVGVATGFRALFARYPDDGLSIVMLSNRSDFVPKVNGDSANNYYAHMDKVSDIYFDAD